MKQRWGLKWRKKNGQERDKLSLKCGKLLVCPVVFALWVETLQRQWEKEREEEDSRREPNWAEHKMAMKCQVVASSPETSKGEIRRSQHVFCLRVCCVCVWLHIFAPAMVYFLRGKDVPLNLSWRNAKHVQPDNTSRFEGLISQNGPANHETVRHTKASYFMSGVYFLRPSRTDIAYAYVAHMQRDGLRHVNAWRIPPGIGQTNTPANEPKASTFTFFKTTTVQGLPCVMLLVCTSR